MISRPRFPGWPRIICAGKEIEITPGWILVRLQSGLTPRDIDAVALAAHQIGIPIEALYRMALAMLAESEDAL